MLVFEERGKPEYTEKNLSEQGREPTTNSTHTWIEPGTHWWEARERSHHCAIPAPQGPVLFGSILSGRLGFLVFCWGKPFSVGLVDQLFQTSNWNVWQSTGSNLPRFNRKQLKNCSIEKGQSSNWLRLGRLIPKEGDLRISLCYRYIPVQ